MDHRVFTRVAMITNMINKESNYLRLQERIGKVLDDFYIEGYDEGSGSGYTEGHEDGHKAGQAVGLSKNLEELKTVHFDKLHIKRGDMDFNSYTKLCQALRVRLDSNTINMMAYDVTGTPMEA